MPRFVALLRGVNVGKGNRVPMAAFREVLEGLGAIGVRTVLNSGNAVFARSGRSAPAHATAIKAALADRLDIDVHVIVKQASSFRAAVAADPFARDGTDDARVLLAFAPDARTLRTLTALESLPAPPERFIVGHDAGYACCPDGILRSPVAKALLGPAGRAITTRNRATARRIAALLPDDRAD